MSAVEAPEVFWHPETGTVYRHTEPFYQSIGPGGRQNGPWTAVDPHGLTGAVGQLPPDVTQLIPLGPLRKLAAECSADSILTAAWAGDALSELLNTLTSETRGTNG